MWVLRVVPSNIISSHSYREVLTGLLSLPVFVKKMLAQAKKDAEKGTFGSYYPIYFNLTNFKIYNSSFVRYAGNRLLQIIADDLLTYFPDE